MKHIFLTGEIQVGKSTVIQNTLSLLTIKYGGFCTFFGNDRYEPEHCLYINEASGSRSISRENAVAYFSASGAPQPLPERFDALGTKYLAEAAANAKLIIMDECGNLERDAILFQDEILHILDGNTPVLGVLKLSASGWADKIRFHPSVNLITVDKANRDELPLVLYKILREL